MGMAEFNEKLNNMIELILVYKVISNMSWCHIFGNSINLNTKNEVKWIENQLIKVKFEGLCNFIIIKNYNRKHITRAQKIIGMEFFSKDN